MLEVCIDSIESALAASDGGAKRLELCTALSEGGLTPSLGLLRAVKKRVNIPVYCMVRPRTGPMIYSEAETEVILEDAKSLVDVGADGLVFGAVTCENSVDTSLCFQLRKELPLIPITFHRAFDVIKEPLIALESIINLGFNRILTSGCHQSALQGMHVIAELVQVSKGRIVVMAGAGINSDNVADIMKRTGVVECHASARVCKMFPDIDSSGVKMGHGDDNVQWVTSCQQVQEICKIMFSLKS